MGAVNTPPLPDIEAALRLFDETTTTLAARIRRLEEVLMQKQQELVAANAALSGKVEELDHLSSYLSLVMGSVASGVIAIGRSGIITTCNPAAAHAIETVSQHPVGADYRTMFPDSPLLKVLAGAAEQIYERTVQAPDGTRRILAVTASPLRLSNNEIVGAVEVFEDVTEVRRLQESLERADRLKHLGEMAAGVAHEIRNPLNGIEGFASLLSRDLPPTDPRHKYALAVVEGVRNLNRTVSGLLEFTKPRRLSYQDVEPVALVESCLELVRSELTLPEAQPQRGESNAPSLTCVNRWPGGAVRADGHQLRQVLLNLAQNAVHAVAGCAGRIEVTVAALASKDGVEGLSITVDDNGPGVAKDARHRIFTPFYSTKDHGTGLGLAVSYTTINQHEGTLGVDDSPLGGARFAVWIPKTVRI
jgi:signal transduction histidine kinase